MAWNYPYGGYNPSNTYMPQQAFAAPQSALPPQPITNPQPMFNCRPVTSKEEAQAVQVDFFGPGTLMPDLAHGVVYLKRFNQQTGACDIYEFVERQHKDERPVQYATIEDLNPLRDEFMRRVNVNDANE